MGVTLGENRYGKAQIRLMKVDRDSESHVLHDLNVSVSLAGDFAATHLHGDNSKVLPTDTQKNIVYAFAREHGVREIEEFALLLARHFVDSQPSITWARVDIEEYSWDHLKISGGPAPHSFVNAGRDIRTTSATCHGADAWVLSGVSDLVLLSSTGSEFRGYIKDDYTTLAEAADRILCTSLTARWRHDSTRQEDEPQWQTSYDDARNALTDAFADTHSKSLQQTLYVMGERLVTSCAGVVEVRLSLPNRHHFLVDLSPFGLDNAGQVFHVDDRPYGLIEGTVLLDEATAAPEAW